MRNADGKDNSYNACAHLCQDPDVFPFSARGFCATLRHRLQLGLLRPADGRELPLDPEFMSMLISRSLQRDVRWLATSRVVQGAASVASRSIGLVAGAMEKRVERDARPAWWPDRRAVPRAKGNQNCRKRGRTRRK